MMASIAHMFMQTGLVSPLEANYWTSLMIEQVNRQECDDLNRKLSEPASGFYAHLVRLNWRRRKHNIEKALARVDKKIHLIEQYIAFVTPPHVRKAASRKLGVYHA
jgi:hypothetical protein